jgi:16S rRNA G966 N2-methylase RsmD
MNDIEKTKQTLPATAKELQNFILFTSEKHKNIIQQLKSIDRLDLGHDVYAGKLREAQEVGDEVLDAKVKLGELLSINQKSGAKIESTKEGTFKHGGSISTLPPNIDKKKSHEYQTLFRNKELVEEEKQAAREAEDSPSTRAVLKAVKEKTKNDRIGKEDNDRKKKIKDIEIRKGDFKIVLDDIKNIDAIVTDPPYPKEFIQCFSDLSLYAKTHLKDDGFLVCYSGQYNLPEVIQRLSEHLTYVWTFCLYHVGKKQLVNGVNIMCGWKPILIFSKGKKKMRFSAYDVLESKHMEKSSHEWQQSESGVSGLIEIFTEPGQLIVDPFAGSGTFLKVAKDEGREAIGAEIE